MNTPPPLIDLHFVPTANGQKITIMLEECGLPYRSIRKPHGAASPGAPNISTLNPIGRYPVIVDPTGPDGAPGLFRDRLEVFRRTGEPCYRCGTAVERSVVAQRGTHSCPRCQPL